MYFNFFYKNYISIRVCDLNFSYFFVFLFKKLPKRRKNRWINFSWYFKELNISKYSKILSN
ncbi:hypothetical protein MYM_0653 [Mesomycoplasma hyorhinis GDL-1]|nr:hypothetical protein MYM_0653 [Mesomycoplasma hyorhinis GDL-1]